MAESVHSLQTEDHKLNFPNLNSRKMKKTHAHANRLPRRIFARECG